MRFGDILGLGRFRVGGGSLAGQTERAAVTGPDGDTVAQFSVETQGANGAKIFQFTGTRDPNGLVTGNPGDLYFRKSGANSAIYVNTGAAPANTVWTALAALSSTSTIWMPDAPPAAPNALDWEGDADITQWTDWDFGARQGAPAYANRHLVLDYTGAAGIAWSGVYQAVGTTQYVVVAKILPLTLLANATRVGLALFQDATVNTADLVAAFRYAGTTGNRAYVATYTAYNGVETVNFGTDYVMPQYMRWRVNGTAATPGFSEDGVSWYEGPAMTLGFTPAHFGPVVLATAVTTVALKMAFFRVVDGVSGLDSVTTGNAVRVLSP